MSVRQEYANIGWLHALVANKKSRIASLLGEAFRYGLPALMKPRIFHKFLELLAQVDAEREEENQIIGRIEAIESRHRMNLANHRLEHASPAYEPKPQAGLDEEEQMKHRKGLWRVFDVFLKPAGHNYDN